MNIFFRLRWLIVIATICLSFWLLPGLSKIQEDNDVLAFLPSDHPDVQTFYDVAERYGVLEVGLIGLSKPEGDMLSAERVGEIRTLSKRLEEMAGVNLVLSFVDLPNPQVHEDGLEVAPLVPESLTDAEAIRKQVLSSTDAVGNLISADGKAAALFVFMIREPGAAGMEQRKLHLQAIREFVTSTWKGEVFFGGAPFLEDTAARVSREDIEKLSPIVIGVLILTSSILLGSLTAAVLNVLITGLGVALIMGAHGIFGEPLTIVSSSIPVMMVALGGAFGVHILAGYQRQPAATSKERAWGVLQELWKPVLLSGLTTCVAFFALIVMPQVPMQRFGLVAGIGVIALLGLALFVLPAILSFLPQSLIRSKEQKAMPIRFQPPLWLLISLAVVGGVMGFRMQADPDTSNVFSQDSEPIRANEFFNHHFSGSTFLQVAIDGDLSEPAVVREIREVVEQIKQVEGVVDVRSVVDPIAMLNHALGGRKGVPETPARGQRVLTYLIGHPAMAQLMTSEADGALVHIKLSPMTGLEQVEVTKTIRTILQRYETSKGVLTVVPANEHGSIEEQLADIKQRLERQLHRSDVDVAKLHSASQTTQPNPQLLARIQALRDKALNSEESPVEGVPLAEIASIEPQQLIQPRGQALEALLRERLPSLQESDPEGIGFVANHLGPWIDEELAKYKVEARCRMLDLPLQAQAEKNPSSCEAMGEALSELDDQEWGLRTPSEGAEGRTIKFVSRLTGQPVIGQAFAESVTESMSYSTLVSLVGLILVLLPARQILAIIPALWTLCVTLGVLSLLGMPISVGTSMISCIALGAGVDFAIHLLSRARTHRGPQAGQKAVNELGAVILISAVQLACAFMVLIASDMAPLKDFGVGLAIGLVVAALGSVWLIPRLIQNRER